MWAVAGRFEIVKRVGTRMPSGRPSFLQPLTVERMFCFPFGDLTRIVAPFGGL